MAFTGKYMLESEENYMDFLNALEMTEECSSGDIITDIYQHDIFRVTKFFVDRTWSNAFVIGKECQLQTLDGQTFKTTVTLDGGILKIQFPKYLYTAQVVGDKLVEVHTLGKISTKMISKKM